MQREASQLESGTSDCSTVQGGWKWKSHREWALAAKKYFDENRVAISTMSSSCDSKNAPGMTVSHAQTSTPLPALSPMFGALSNSFDSAKLHDAAEIADAVFNVLQGRVFHSTEVSAFVAEFCQSPVVYTAYSYFRLFIQDKLLGVSGRQKHELLLLATEAPAMMRRIFAAERVPDESVESVILSMIMMPREQNRSTAHGRIDAPNVHLFRPYNTPSVMIKALQSSDCFHLPAARSLVEQKGGLQNIRMPGLAKLLLGSAISQASDTFSQPVFSEAEKYFPLRRTQAISLSDHDGIDELPGCGFRAVPGGLPKNTRNVLEHVAMLDQALCYNTNVPVLGVNVQSLMSSRAFVHYHLLCLPSWHDLSSQHKGQSQMAVYESCRLAALLYFNAVLRLTPAGDGPGITEPVRLLSTLLPEIGDVVDHSNEKNKHHVGFFLWILLVGGLGAYHLPSWQTFVSSLAIVTHRFRIFSWEDAKERVGSFIWSDPPCQAGLEILWCAAQRERERLHGVIISE